MVKNWYRVDFSENHRQVIAQVEAESEQEAISIVEAAHPESRYCRMLSVTGPTDEPEYFRIDNLGALGHPWIVYVNTLENL